MCSKLPINLSKSDIVLKSLLMKYKENAYCDALRYLVLFVQIKKREKPL